MRTYKSTVVQKGASSLFFLYFWLTKFLSFLQQHSEFLNSLVHRTVRHLPHPEFTIRNASGIFVVQPFDDSTAICSDYFEAHLRPWLTRPLHKDLFIDIGANRGLYTILALTTYGYREVHAFEPNPEVAHILQENILLNGIHNRTAIHTLGLGAEETKTYFTVDVMHKGGGRVTEKAISSDFEIAIKPFDAILDEREVSRISFIKIDTEGYEFEVLLGMKKTLRGMKEGSCLMIESTNHVDLETILASYGFTKAETIAHDHLFIKRHA